MSSRLSLLPAGKEEAAVGWLRRKRINTLPEEGTTPPEVKGYLPILDGWRAVAILLVVLFHGFFNSDAPKNRIIATIAGLSGKFGALGVLIFFCISGYLITTRLLLESERHGSFSLKIFYIKRSFRIIPLLLGYLIVIITLFYFGLIPLVKKDWAAPAFLANYIYGSWYTTQFWSLSVEEHFYLAWPLCVYFAGWRRSMWIGCALVGVVGIWRPWHLQGATSPVHMLRHTDMRLDYIMMGCIIAIAVRSYPKFADGVKLTGSGIGLLVLFFGLVLTTKQTSFDLRSVQAAILTLMVCGTSIARAPAPTFLLANPFMLFMGRISYSIYIWQELILAPSRISLIRSIEVLPFRLLLVIAVAYLSYRFIERPFISLGNKVVGRLS